MTLGKKSSTGSIDTEGISDSRILQTIFNFSPLGILVTNKNGKIIRFNKRVSELLDIPESELTDYIFDDLPLKQHSTNGTNLREDQNFFEKIKAKKQSIMGVPLKTTLSTGRVCQVSFNGSPLMDDTGQFAGIIAVIEDNTMRKSAEDVIAESEKNTAAYLKQTLPR